MSSTYGQGPATLATGVDLTHDTTIGVTNPNLHRRIDVSNIPLSGELSARQYLLGLYGTHSYRTTIITIHDEDSEISEVP